MKIKKVNENPHDDIVQPDLGILLLGLPLSGKSTIFRQITLLHKGEYDEESLKLLTPIIVHNTLTSICNILQFLTDSNSPSLFEDPHTSDDVRTLLEFEKNIFEKRVSDDIWDCIERLWANKLIRQSIEHFDHNEYFLLDSASYFLDNVSRIRDPFYKPNNSDVMRYYVRTTGFHELNINLNNQNKSTVEVLDCGSDHRRWVHAFNSRFRDKVVVFCVSLSDYNLIRYRDQHTNRLHFSLTLFESLLKKIDDHVPVILLLNKVDIFQQKLEKIPLKVSFPDYEGNDVVEEACQFIRQKFEVLGEIEGREIHSFVTCAVDLESSGTLWKNILECSSISD